MQRLWRVVSWWGGELVEELLGGCRPGVTGVTKVLYGKPSVNRWKPSVPRRIYTVLTRMNDDMNDFKSVCFPR